MKPGQKPKAKRWLFYFGAGYLILLVVLALSTPLFKYQYADKVGAVLLPPSGQYWFGTDQQGRDVFTRVIFGARMSLFIGLSVQMLCLILGVLVGVGSSMGPKWLQQLLQRITDAMFAFPDILLAILIIGVWPRSLMGDGILPVIVALTITSWPAVARIVKNQVASLKDREFIQSTMALGAPMPYVVFKHLLPQLWGLLLAITMVDLAGTILAESSLSFLGIGITPPLPSWGSMINDGRGYINSNPMLLLWPCLVLSLTIFSLNFVGDALREMTDPRSK